MNPDDLSSKDLRLKYGWRWIRDGAQLTDNQIKKMRHFQVSCAHLSDWQMEAVEWSRDYEARINYAGEPIARQNGFKSRIDAQIGAEKLLKNWIREQS